MRHSSIQQPPVTTPHPAHAGSAPASQRRNQRKLQATKEPTQATSACACACACDAAPLGRRARLLAGAVPAPLRPCARASRRRRCLSDSAWWRGVLEHAPESALLQLACFAPRRPPPVCCAPLRGARRTPPARVGIARARVSRPARVTCCVRAARRARRQEGAPRRAAGLRQPCRRQRTRSCPRPRCCRPPHPPPSPRRPARPQRGCAGQQTG